MEDMEEIRHSLTNVKLEELYRKLDDFISDLTWEEVQEHLQALNEVKTIIHQRMNENTKKSVEEEKSDEDRKKHMEKCKYYLPYSEVCSKKSGQIGSVHVSFRCNGDCDRMKRYDNKAKQKGGKRYEKRN